MVAKNFGPSTFGELNAADYDERHDPGTTEECVGFIADIAGSGRILELAIGTGRIALPLAQRGLDVRGIDGSPDMVAKLREKPGGDAISVAIGNFADVDVDGSFDLVFLAFNTLFNLTSQSEQVRCFKNVASRLRDGGAFLIEAFVPDVTRFTDGQMMRATRVDFESIWFEAATHDPVRQLIEHQRVRLTADGVRMIPLPMRYAWPAELDLMANLAGLELEHRWGAWDGSPFTAKSENHISLYRKSMGPAD